MLSKIMLPASDLGNSQNQHSNQNQKNEQTNPRLKKVPTPDGTKHYYALDGIAQGPAYPKRTHARSELKKPAYIERPLLGEQGDEGIVVRKNNPDALFCLKIRPSEPLDKLYKRIKTTNDIARLVSSNELLRQHCVVEVFRKSNNGNDIYVARLIDGFTLEDYLRNPHNFPELDSSLIKTKLSELEPVITALFQGGYVNEDISSTNIMYDRSSRNFVLIDFTRAKKTNDVKDLEYVLGELRSECRQAQQNLPWQCIIM